MAPSMDAGRPGLVLGPAARERSGGPGRRGRRPRGRTLGRRSRVRERPPRDRSGRTVPSLLSHPLRRRRWPSCLRCPRRSPSQIVLRESRRTKGASLQGRSPRIHGRTGGRRPLRLRGAHRARRHQSLLRPRILPGTSRRPPRVRPAKRNADSDEGVELKMLRLPGSRSPAAGTRYECSTGKGDPR